MTDHEGGWKPKENRHMDLTFDEYIGIECPENDEKGFEYGNQHAIQP